MTVESVLADYEKHCREHTSEMERVMREQVEETKRLVAVHEAQERLRLAGVKQPQQRDANTISRKDFEAQSAAARMDFVKRGGRLVD